jgi:hypothetical protein
LRPRIPTASSGVGYREAFDLYVDRLLETGFERAVAGGALAAIPGRFVNDEVR